MTILLSFFLGWVTGLRSLMGLAVICWAAHLGWLHIAGTRLGFLGHPVALTLFTVLALLELVADKLPQTPSRIALSGLIPRIIFGGFAGVALALSSGAAMVPAAVVGIAGAIAGAFAGYHLRRALVMRAHLPDFAVALAEDAIAIGAGFLIVSRL
jgi:uncharacterized membrane protein